MIHYIIFLCANIPISAHITENRFSQGYVLSLTDLVYIASHCKELDKDALEPLIELLKMKQTKTKGWKNDYISRYNGYQPFSFRRQDCPWITEMILHFLKSNSEMSFKKNSRCITKVCVHIFFSVIKKRISFMINTSLNNKNKLIPIKNSYFLILTKKKKNFVMILLLFLKITKKWYYWVIKLIEE